MKNASASGPAPRIAASTMSRAKPVTRETSVSPPTVRMRDSMRLFAWTLGREGRPDKTLTSDLRPRDENLGPADEKSKANLTSGINY